MRVADLSPGCRCAIYTIVACAAALMLDAASAQQSSPRPASRAARTSTARVPSVLINGPDREGRSETVVIPPPRDAAETEELVQPAPEPIEVEPLPQAYQIPLRRPAEGLVIQTEDGLISLAARDTPVTEVLTALAELQGLNLITQDTMTGTLNTTLNRVPIQDALDVILEMTGHTWTRSKNIILVSRVAKGGAISAESQGRKVAVFELDYVAAADVSLVVTNMLSPIGTASVVASANDDNRRTQELLIVEDLPRYLASIDAYIRQHDVPPRQVMIEAYILQVELSDELRHGVNFDQLIGMSNNLLRIEGRNFAQASGSQGFFVNLSGGNLGALVEILETAADAKTLAAPKIRVLNGQTARIQVGEQLGFRVTTVTETAATESVQFLNVGVVLEVTPRIAADGTVVMRVRPEVSSGAVNPTTGLPEEETTELETDVMFQNNRAFVIGGLIQETNNDNQSKVPWLGDWHHLGRLFQRREATKRRSEIIIALLPRVMTFEEPEHEQYEVESERARTPLLYGSLDEFPRPWEAQLPDASDNPAVRMPRHWTQWFRGHNCSTDHCEGECEEEWKSLDPVTETFGLQPVPEKIPPSPEDLIPATYTARRLPRTDTTGGIRMSRLPSTRGAPSSSASPPPGPPIRLSAPGTMLR